MLNDLAEAMKALDGKKRVWRHRLVWLHSVCTTTMLLHVPHLCEYCLEASLAEINHFAGLHSSPMKLGVCTTFAMAVWKFFHWSAKLPVRHHRLPPCWGGYLAL